MSTPSDPFSTTPPPARESSPTWGGQPQAYGAPPATWGAGQPAYAGSPSTSSRAIIALCCAIGSFLVFPLVPAVVALALAPGARDEIRGSGGRIGGEGLVTAAKVLAWVNIGLCVFAVLALVLLFVVLAGTGFS